MLRCIIFTSLFRWHLLRQRALQEWLIGFVGQGFFFSTSQQKGAFFQGRICACWLCPVSVSHHWFRRHCMKGNILATQDKLLRKRQYLWSVQAEQGAVLILEAQVVELSVFEGMRGWGSSGCVWANAFGLETERLWGLVYTCKCPGIILPKNLVWNTSQWPVLFQAKDLLEGASTKKVFLSS